MNKRSLLTLAIILAGYFTHAQSYLPLTAGSVYPLTGTLFSNSTEAIRIGGNNVYMSAFDNSGNQRTGYLQFNPNGPIILAANNATSLAMMGANVGIGTTTPNAALQIVKSSTAYTDVPEQIWSPSITGYDLKLSNYNSDYGIDYRFTQYIAGNPNYVLTFQGGNVGIGTTKPMSIFNVAAASGNQVTINNTSPTLYGNENQSIVFNGTNNAGGGGLLELLRLKVTSTNGGIAAGRVDFSQNGSSVPTLSFTPNRYVGIGTPTPDKMLTVNGTIHATEVLVDQSVPTPDYVFDKDYDLASLKDVKTYIDKNHHLSEIPSAEQVAKEGINLGEMNVKLLKKIEELTLYLIEMKAQLKKQEQQIRLLKYECKNNTNNQVRL